MVRADRIARLIEERLNEARWLRSGMVPSLRALRDEFNCPIPTIRTALRILSDKRMLVRIGRNGRYAPPESATEDRSCGEASVYRWQAVAESVRQDLYGGHILCRTPLSLKELAARYECNHRTMRKSLDLLMSEGVISRNSMGYLSRGSHDRARSSRVIVIGNNCSWSSFNTWDERLYRGIELGIRDLGWKRTDFTNPVAVDELGLDSSTVPAGIICQLRFQRHWTSMYMAIARACRKRNLPLVMIDISDSGISLADIARHRRGFQFELDHYSAGCDMARYIVSAGHTGTAFFSPMPFDPSQVASVEAAPQGYKGYPWANLAKWAHHRFGGLRETLAKSNAGHVCRGFVIDSGRSMQPESFANLRNGIRSAMKTVKANDVLSHNTVKQTFDRLYALSDTLATGLGAQAVFSEALNDRRLTAWVCVNDELAAMARHFLARHSLPRAAKITVVGFDNSSLAIRDCFTSYDFLPENLGLRAVRALAFPDSLKCDRKRRVTFQGELMVR